MKLKRLKTHAFRSIQDSEIEFGDVATILAGQVGAGKSSHCHSLCAVLTGRTPHTDRRGAGIKSQIRRDQARAEIELECDFSTVEKSRQLGIGLNGNSVIKRNITDGSQTLEVPFGGKNLSAKQALLTERMGGVDEVPDVLLDPRLFADRDEKEQTQALLKLLRPPAIEVPPAARAVGIQNLASIQQVDDQIKSLKDGSIRSLNAVINNLEETCPAEPTAEELAAAHQAAESLRELEARIQSLILEVQSAQYQLDDARKHAQEVEEAKKLVVELPTLRAKRDEIAADETKLSELVRQQDSLTKDLQYARERNTKVAAAKDAAEKLPGLRKALEDARSQLQITASRYKDLQVEAADQRAKAEALKASTQSLTESTDWLKTESSQCPTCSQKLTPKAKSELLTETLKQRDKQQACWMEQSKKSGEAHQELTLESSKGAEQRKNVDRLMQEVAIAEQAAKEVDIQTIPEDDIQGKIDEIKSDLSKLQSKYETGLEPIYAIRRVREITIGAITEAERAEKLVAAPQPNAFDLETNLATVTANLSGAQEILPRYKQQAESARDTLRRAEEYRNTATKLTAERSKRESYLAAVESLEKLKDSILGGESARKLQFDCTEIFQRFFPAARVILDPSGASVAPLGSNDGTPVAHLSSGQKVIFDMGLRIAAARATGFNLLAIDDANKLAPAGREAMLKCLMSSGCQFIMCTTADKIGSTPGATVYSVSSPGVWGPTKVERVK